MCVYEARAGIFISLFVMWLLRLRLWNYFILVLCEINLIAFVYSWSSHEDDDDDHGAMYFHLSSLNRFDYNSLATILFLFLPFLFPK